MKAENKVKFNIKVHDRVAGKYEKIHNFPEFLVELIFFML